MITADHFSLSRDQRRLLCDRRPPPSVLQGANWRLRTVHLSFVPTAPNHLQSQQLAPRLLQPQQNLTPCPALASASTTSPTRASTSVQLSKLAVPPPCATPRR